MQDPEEMPDLDPRAAALLSAYRHGTAMPPDARVRVQDRVRDASPWAHIVSLAERRRTLREWAVVLAAAAAVVVVWALDAGRRAEAERSDAAVMSPSQGVGARSLRQTSARQERGTPQVSEASTGESTATLPIGTTDGERADGAVAGRTAAGSKWVTRRAASTSGDGGENARTARHGSDAGMQGEADEGAPSRTLREETEMLARGWRAIAAGDVAAATAAVDEHARRFAAGALAPERAALAAVSACTGSSEHGEELARAFLAAHPRSPLTRRVRDACELTP